MNPAERYFTRPEQSYTSMPLFALGTLHPCEIRHVILITPFVMYPFHFWSYINSTEVCMHEHENCEQLFS